MTRCIESKFVEKVNGYDIAREVDRKVDPLTSEPYGSRTVFYAVYKDEWLTESFKTLKEARRYAENS